MGQSTWESEMMHEKAEEEHFHIERLAMLFTTLAGGTREGELTRAELKEALQKPEVRAYGVTLGLGAWNVKEIAGLLSSIDGEKIDVYDFVDGCMHVRGVAQAVDMHKAIVAIREMELRFADMER